MFGELIFSLFRVAIYFFIFYFLYRVVGSFLRGLTGNDNKRPPQGQTPQPPPQKPVQTYTDVADAKFKDIPSEKRP